MERFGPEEARIVAETINCIAENAKSMIYNLNKNWKILGVDDITRQKRTRDLVTIVQERYDEVISETKEKVEAITEEINRLYAEFVELKEYLNSNATTKYDAEETLITKKKILLKDVEMLRNMVKIRTEKITKLNEWQKKLNYALGGTQKMISDNPLPSDEIVKKFERYLQEQQCEYDKRIQIFMEKQALIISLFFELEEKPCDSFQKYIVDSSSKDFLVTDSNMSKLVIVYDGLVEQMKQKKSEIFDMREKLDVLWERLGESASYRSEFSTKYTGHSNRTENALIDEIHRCEEEKRKSLKKFIGKVRNEIEDMWNCCYYSALQKDKFAEYSADDYNEDILIIHESYLENIKKFYDDNKNIFDLYEERQKLWQKWKELEEKSKEPGRFHNRGGQLLREEKERKKVASQLPKIEKELTKLVQEYENNTGMQFTINGHTLILIMEEDWDKKTAERQNQLSARKQKNIPRTPLSVTKSAPSHRLLPTMNRDTLTAVKRRLSPRNSPHSSKIATNLARRLQFPSTPVGSTSELNKSAKTRKSKHLMPTIAVNGYLMKKKMLGRLSQESKGRRRSRQSRSKSPTKRVNSNDVTSTTTISSYSNFVEHLNNDATCRSSVVPDRYLRSRAHITETVKFQPDGQFVHNIETKENISPSENVKKRKFANTNADMALTPSKYREVFDNTSFSSTRSNVNVFATPQRPAVKGKLITRQNTVTLASPSVMNTQPLRRSNSTHNLRQTAMSPSYTASSPKIQFTSKMRLII